MSWTKTKEIKTTHKNDCKRVFKNYDMTCGRCMELSAGMKPRAGWNDLKNRNDAMTLRAIAEHDFKACAEKNVCCTHFDY